MISIKSRGLKFPTEGLRCFSLAISQCQKTHYDTLKISKDASPADVKSAYYKLSKKYHPDANKNDPAATEKFQEISEAYEILGNEDSRMRYDKGMAPIDRLTYTDRKAGFGKVPVDPKAAFYKARLHNKMKSPTAGRVYNFDDWTKNHYSASIASNRHLKSRLEQKTQRTVSYAPDSRESQESYKKANRLEGRVALTLVAFFVLVGVIYELNEPDSPKRIR